MLTDARSAPYAAVIAYTMPTAADGGTVATGAGGGALSTDIVGIVDEIRQHHGAAADDRPAMIALLHNLINLSLLLERKNY